MIGVLSSIMAGSGPAEGSIHIHRLLGGVVTNTYQGHLFGEDGVLLNNTHTPCTINRKESDFFKSAEKGSFGYTFSIFSGLFHVLHAALYSPCSRSDSRFEERLTVLRARCHGLADDEWSRCLVAMWVCAL